MAKNDPLFASAEDLFGPLDDDYDEPKRQPQRRQQRRQPEPDDDDDYDEPEPDYDEEPDDYDDDDDDYDEPQRRPQRRPQPNRRQVHFNRQQPQYNSGKMLGNFYGCDSQMELIAQFAALIVLLFVMGLIMNARPVKRALSETFEIHPDSWQMKAIMGGTLFVGASGFFVCKHYQIF